MRIPQKLLLALASLSIAALMGCNLPRQDTAAVQTAAALTVRAALTQAAPSATYTPVPSPAGTVPAPGATVVPTAQSGCDKAQFISETVPDNSAFSEGEDFVKSWTLKNVGTCSWTPSYSLAFVSGDVMGGPAKVALTGNVNSGQTTTFSISLEAPDADGTYLGKWGLRNSAGVLFAQFWVQIKVGDADDQGKFAVTHVSYTFSLSDYAGKDDCPMMTAHITTNGPGDVTYRWTRSDGASSPDESLSFASAGTKDVVTHWALGSAWEGDTHWLGIYVDEPNHQDFGHKTFTKACAP